MLPGLLCSKVLNQFTNLYVLRLAPELTFYVGTNLKIYPEEMSRLGQTSLEMTDGSGYLAALGVYHELHCIASL